VFATVAGDKIICRNCRLEYPGDALFCPNCGAAKAREDGGDPLLGQAIGDRFLLIKRIGQGTSGNIYLAEHVTLRRKVAVKVLHHELSRDELAIERFRREATSVSGIDNEHIVEIFDFGRAADGRLYLAMEYLEGETLADVIEREGRLPVERVVDVLTQLGEALMEAHAMGYVHRDLRPRNVFLTRRKRRDDYVKLLDFGLSKLVESEGAAASTSLGMTFGDPHYMSPEQARGDGIDRRADIYSLGCIAYQMLVGHPPFSGGRVFDVLTRHISEQPVEPAALRPDLPAWLNRALLRMLAKRPEDRFITVYRLIEALRQGSDSGVIMSDEIARRPETEQPPSQSRRMQRFDDDGAVPEPVGTVASGSGQVAEPPGPPPDATTPGVMAPRPAAFDPRSTQHGFAGDDTEKNQLAPGGSRPYDGRETVHGFGGGEGGEARSGPVDAAAAAQAAPVSVPGSHREPSPPAQGRVHEAPTRRVPEAAAPAGPAAAPPSGPSDGRPRLAATVLSSRQEILEARAAATPPSPASGPPSPLAAPGKVMEAAAPSESALAALEGRARVESPRAEGKRGGGDENAQSSTGLSSAWFADGDALGGQDELTAEARRRLEKARKSAPPSVSSTGEMYFDERPRRRWLVPVVVIAVLGLAALAVARLGGGDGDEGGEAKPPEVAAATPATPAPDPDPSPAAVPEPGAAAVPEPAADTPAVAAPPAGQPAAATTTKEPTVKEPTAKEPTAKEPRVKEPKVKEPKVKEPRVKDGAAAGAGDEGGAKGSSEDRQKAEFFAKLGDRDQASGDILGAATNYNKARELDPQNTTALIGLGEIALGQSSFEAAISHLRKAAKLRSSSGRVHTLLGEAYLGAGKATEAAASFKKALQLDPDNGRARDGYNEATGGGDEPLE
jgi:serine/threonine protein kinase